MAADPLAWPRGRPFRLATRGSPLALVQTRIVGDLMRARHPGLQVEQVVVSTSGDRRRDVPLDRLGGQGVFVKEVQAVVMERGAEAAVHSAKDLPSETPEGLVIAAVPERADPRDALAGMALADLPPGGVVATGSPRRRAQLANRRPDLTFVELRGNVGTRLARTADGSVHAVVVAMAALERLGWSERAAEILSPTQMLPQVGQGALAAECRADRPDVASVLSAVDDPRSHRALTAERSFLAALGAGCTAPIAGWAEPGEGCSLRLHGMLASGDGRVLLRASREGDDAAALGAWMAEHLMKGCGGETIEGSEGWARSGSRP